MAATGYRKLVCKDLHSYLRSLPPSVLDKLYCHPATCLAVYRDLPELARHYVMRILFVEQAVAQAVVKQWSTTSSEEQLEAAAALMELRVWYEQPLPGGMPGWLLNPIFRKNLATSLLGGGTPWLGNKNLTPDKYAKDVPFLDKYALERWEASDTVLDKTCAPKYKEQLEAAAALMELRVWYEQPLPGGMPGWLLNPIFRKNLATSLLGGGTPWLGNKNLTPDKYAKDVPFLDKYALERWECVLHFMVGSNEGSDGVNKDITDILLHSRLMRVDDGEPSITAEGFQFLLMDTSSQVWFFLLQYLDTVQTRGMDLVECLTFLFQLSFSTLGKDYSAEDMNENQLRFLQHLREFGLVYQRKRKSHRYYPTRLAINIVSGVSKAVAASTKLDTHRPGFIVVETNYRVYAYTNSPLQVALLALFCEMLYRFPNLAVANLTRASVRAAMSRGITAEQILHFLVSHAHPEMMKNVSARWISFKLYCAVSCLQICSSIQKAVKCKTLCCASRLSL
ncbi:general transcription factor IIH subunit 4 [Elysia marginata]|uniref:General transcription factor IIH subunit 4 n=1 Tax=Elysia marginata TaxID=1093978 RepID=A0AAV4F3Q4_9GAST|nr:general transcription factor IIH subunit 4 [Elysia marginata]